MVFPPLDPVWELDVGMRFRSGDGYYVVAARFSRSLVDIQPADVNERMLNEVATVSVGFVRPR